jgi:hypothetical protein
MFDPRSRYASIATGELELAGPGGSRTVRYVRRRFIPDDPGSVLIVEHQVKQGERLDNITALYLGDPTQFWRLCDVNGVLGPDEVTREIGTWIRIAIRAM